MNKKMIAYILILSSLTACGTFYGTHERCYRDTYKPLGYEEAHGRDEKNKELIDWGMRENHKNNGSISTWLTKGRE